MGTAEYMAPEQARSADKVDARADLYAVGVMLYEMIAGRRGRVAGEDARVIASRSSAARSSRSCRRRPDAAARDRGARAPRDGGAPASSASRAPRRCASRSRRPSAGKRAGSASRAEAQRVAPSATVADLGAASGDRGAARSSACRRPGPIRPRVGAGHRARAPRRHGRARRPSRRRFSASPYAAMAPRRGAAGITPRRRRSRAAACRSRSSRCRSSSERRSWRSRWAPEPALERVRPGRLQTPPPPNSAAGAAAGAATEAPPAAQPTAVPTLAPAHGSPPSPAAARGPSRPRAAASGAAAAGVDAGHRRRSRRDFPAAFPVSDGASDVNRDSERHRHPVGFPDGSSERLSHGISERAPGLAGNASAGDPRARPLGSFGRPRLLSGRPSGAVCGGGVGSLLGSRGRALAHP